jgi:hypothetical protein
MCFCSSIHESNLDMYRFRPQVIQNDLLRDVTSYRLNQTVSVIFMLFGCNYCFRGIILIEDSLTTDSDSEVEHKVHLRESIQRKNERFHITFLLWIWLKPNKTNNELIFFQSFTLHLALRSIQIKWFKVIWNSKYFSITILLLQSYIMSKVCTRFSDRGVLREVFLSDRPEKGNLKFIYCLTEKNKTDFNDDKEYKICASGLDNHI